MDQLLLDAFIAYFLGAVIPLGVLVYMTQRYLDATGAQEGGASLLHSRWFLLAFKNSQGHDNLVRYPPVSKVNRKKLTRDSGVNVISSSND